MAALLQRSTKDRRLVLYTASDFHISDIFGSTMIPCIYLPDAAGRLFKFVVIWSLRVANRHKSSPLSLYKLPQTTFDCVFYVTRILPTVQTLKFEDIM